MIKKDQHTNHVSVISFRDAFGAERQIRVSTLHDSGQPECMFDISTLPDTWDSSRVCSNLTREAAIEIISVLAQFLVDTDPNK